MKGPHLRDRSRHQNRTGVPRIAATNRLIAHFYKADPEYGLGVAKRMGIAADEVQPQNSLPKE